MHTNPMSICLESQSAFQCLLLYLVVGMISFILSRAFPGEDGRAPEIKMLAKCCTLLRWVMFFLVFRPFIQITAPYERLGLTTAVLIHFMVFGVNPQVRPTAFLHYTRMPIAFGLLALVGSVLIPSQFAIQDDTQELGRRLHLY